MGIIQKIFDRLGSSFISSNLPFTLFILCIFLNILCIFMPHFSQASIAINKFFICTDPIKNILRLYTLFFIFDFN